MSIKNFITQHPVTSYFTTTFCLSWLSAFIIVAPSLHSGKPIEKFQGILMFPLMIIWPCIVGIALTKITKGKEGLQQLYSRMKKWNVGVKWYGVALFISPTLILLV